LVARGLGRAAGGGRAGGGLLNAGLAASLRLAAARREVPLAAVVALLSVPLWLTKQVCNWLQLRNAMDSLVEWDLAARRRRRRSSTGGAKAAAASADKEAAAQAEEEGARPRRGNGVGLRRPAAADNGASDGSAAGRPTRVRRATVVDK